MHPLEWFCIVFGTCVGLLVTVCIRSQADRQAHEIDVLRQSNARLQAANARLEREQIVIREQQIGIREQLSAAVAVHGHWEWSLLVHDLLQPFETITTHMLEAAVRTCHENGTMYCMRAQVIKGNLFLTDYRAIFFDRHYAPSRVMPLLETLRRHPNLPDVDIVVAAVDEPRVKTLVSQKWWSRLCTAYSGLPSHAVGLDRRQARLQANLPPPLFSSTISRHHLDLPWLDFSFFMPRAEHKLRTPPWSVLQPQMLVQSAKVRWEDKIELAMHTGNVGSPFRKRLCEVAKEHPRTMLVNELFIGDHRKITKVKDDLPLIPSHLPPISL